MGAKLIIIKNHQHHLLSFDIWHYDHQNHHSSIFEFIILSAQLKEEFELSYVNWVGIFYGKKTIAAHFEDANFGASQYPLFILVHNLPSHLCSI
jgi:hypothetical protein